MENLLAKTRRTIYVPELVNKPSFKHTACKDLSARKGLIGINISNKCGRTMKFGGKYKKPPKSAKNKVATQIEDLYIP